MTKSLTQSGFLCRTTSTPRTVCGEGPFPELISGNGPPRKRSGGCRLGHTQIRTVSNFWSFCVTPSIRKSVTSELWCISILPGVAVVRPRPRTRNETCQDFWVRKRGPENRWSGHVDPKGCLVGRKPRTRSGTSCFWAVPE